MKIPLEWLGEYVNIKGKNPKEIADSFTALGLLLDKPIENNILDLEHRMDRSDWLSILGCARDYAAFEGLDLKLPPVNKDKGLVPEEKDKIAIDVKCPQVVNRFNTRVFKDIKVKESPKWMRERLEAYGIPAINNIVDITNYVMVEYGQPMHAQDINKMKAPEIVIRCAKDGEKLTTLLGETVTLSKGQFVLTQADEPTVIGGIVGGKSTAVDSSTTEIVLDAGNYNQNNIRKSSRKLKIQNETVLRYDKFLHPELTQAALERATYLILELAGGKFYENIDWYPQEPEIKLMELRFARVEQIGGMIIGKERIRTILKLLGYGTVEETSEYIKLEIPYFRTDVMVEDDIVADIYRINDYSKIPFAKINTAPPKEITPEIYKFEQQLKDIMVSLKFHEQITDPIIRMTENTPDQVLLENALTSDKNALRTDLLSTLIPVVKLYEKFGLDNIKLFEINRVYKVDGKKTDINSYKEIRTLLAYCNNSTLPRHENVKIVKKTLATLMEAVGVGDYKLDDNKILVKNEVVGEIVHSHFSIFTENLLKHKGLPLRIASDITNYTKENLSLVMPLKDTFGPIYSTIAAHDKRIVSVEVIEEYVGKEIGTDKKTVFVAIEYSTSDTQDIRKSLLKVLKTKFDVELRK